jgi:DNA helicase-2/ATP-dependent DNA helicase PcrA
MAAFRNMIEDLAETVRTKPLNEALAFIEERTGYRRMLEQENTPEAEARIENLNELMNAAADAVERGESIGDFLDHAALVADSDSLDEQSQITLMTIHNAKGLEFPVVFMAGMEDGLFPHSRSLNSEAAMEEERRLCYVGMTRAEKRLVMSWAKYRRRFGGGEQERSMKSRFLGELPSNLVMMMGVEEDEDVPQVDLTAERWGVRESAKKNLYTGKTYNSVENVQQFFKERGVTPPVARMPLSRPAPPIPSVTPPPSVAPRPGVPKPGPLAVPSAPQGTLFGPPPTSSLVRPPVPPPQLIPPVQARRELPKAPPAPKRPAQTGTVVEHPKYGTGTIVRREGEGDDAKVVVIFQRHGMKKLVEKYAGLIKS